ncbi:MAG: translation elongation factor 4 [Bradymonadaceae bacterium]
MGDDTADKVDIDQSRIRNFCIIAHVDHGKSTLADRILEVTNTVADRDREEQLLDQMDLERERGITIKAQTVRLQYTSRDGDEFLLNLIDTPGHVDFTYEVSRSLKACEGALLVVDASQGVEAQTVANVYMALDNDLELIPVLNKIDLDSADPDRVSRELEETLGIDASDAFECSAKEGVGIRDILEAIVYLVPPPEGQRDERLKALVVDSWFDSYRGVVNLVRIEEGTLRTGDEIEWMATGARSEVEEVGVFTPDQTPVDELGPGEVGYVISMMKDIDRAKVGDTITHADRPTPEPLPGFKDVKPMVFSGLYPTDNDDYEKLHDALEKLSLNDSSISFERETSEALGFGFRCGFLGLLHMEVIQERLEREYDLELITTAPSVVYRVETHEGGLVEIDNPTNLPEPHEVEAIREPYIRATIHVPPDHVGPVIELCEDQRGEQEELRYSGSNRVILTYDMPMNEVMFDFYDRLKSASRGYASFDYEQLGYREGDLVRLDILVNEEAVDALSTIVHRDVAYERGRAIAKKLKDVIPRQLFEIPIQAAIGSRIVARETIPAMRKDVTAKCYGGDVTRKKKLLEEQKEGKKRMKEVGTVDVPQEAFLAVLSVDEDE